MYKKIAVLLIAPLFLSQTAFGAGFALYEFSGRTTAMGGATMANKPEAASLAVNPALITELEGTQLQLGATVVTANAETTIYNPLIKQNQSRSLKDDVWILPNFFITHKVSDDVSIGLGGFSRYGLGGEYQDWETWFGSTKAYKVELQTFSFTPTLAVKMNTELSIAMGLEAMIVGFSQANAIPGTGMDATLSGHGISWGGNFSFLYRPDWAERWALGAMYRSKLKQTLNGRIASNIHTIPGLISGIESGDARGSISLPDSISAGLSFSPDDKWTLEAGIVGTFWSAYDQIMAEYKATGIAPLIQPKRYKDAYRVNLGAEYQINRSWAVRAGYVYDQSPINKYAMDTLVPVDDRQIGSVGAGYTTDTWSVDLAYSHVFTKDLAGKTTEGMPIKYTNSRSDMFGLTFGYKF